MKYTPLSIPILGPATKAIKMMFYEKAVLKAYELGGNGIIVLGGGDCKVNKIANAPLIEAAPAESPVNVIFDRTQMDKFATGEVAKAERDQD